MLPIGQDFRGIVLAKLRCLGQHRNFMKSQTTQRSDVNSSDALEFKENAMNKTLSTLATSALVIGILTYQPALAKDSDKAAAVAGVIALGLLGAAVAHHQHREGRDEYRHHPKLHPDENAVGACMHHAKRQVKKAGGHNARLNDVVKVNNRDNGSTVVVFHATGYYDFGHKKSRIRCVVKNHRVKKFSFN